MPVPESLLLNDREQRIADWGDTVEPVIYANETLYRFPRPVRVFRFRDAWDFDRFKVPLKDGETFVGQSRKGVEIVIAGQIATQDGASKQTEAAMFAEIETMRTALNATTCEKFELFLFHDPATPYYRKFKNCSTVAFDLDLTNRTLFGYRVEVHSDDPVIYATAEGV
jgi:hypothetical protein